MTSPQPSPLIRWQRRTELPLLALALVFLVVFLLPLYRPDLPSGVLRALRVLNVAVWVAFAVDYVVRLRLSPDRRAFVRGHVPDLLTLAVPVLRPLRLIRVAGVLGAAGRRAGQARLVGTTAFVVGAVLLLVVVSAGLALDAERDAEGANLTSAGDAMWWALTTVTTVGYGDRFPVTGEGRAVAVGLMLGGIALLGVVTATIAAWFVDRLHDVEEASETTEATLSDVLHELRAVRARLDAMDRA